MGWEGKHVDLHPVPEIQSIVKGISDVSTDGKVYVAGQLDFRPVVWVVDVTTLGVIEHVQPGRNADGASPWLMSPGSAPVSP